MFRLPIEDLTVNLGTVIRHVPFAAAATQRRLTAISAGVAPKS